MTNPYLERQLSYELVADRIRTSDAQRDARAGRSGRHRGRFVRRRIQQPAQRVA
jgi:hypothetical protein